MKQEMELEMEQGTIEQVDLALLQDLPVMAKNLSQKLVQITSQAAKSGQSETTPILVGRVNGLLYTVNEFETVTGLRNAGVRTALAVILDYSDMSELLAVHVRNNFQPRAIDPLRIREVVSYMVEKHGMTAPDACKLLWLDRRPDLLEAVRYEISDEARALLLEMVAEISKKIYIVVTPIPYVEALSKLENSAQVTAATEIKSTCILLMKSEDKSFWPSIDTIKATLKKYKKKKEKAEARKRTSKPSSPEDMKKKKGKDDPDPDVVKKAESFISEDPDLIYVPYDGQKSDLIINKKTGRVAKAKDIDGVCTMVDDEQQPTHTVSPSLIRFLNVEDAADIQAHTFTSHEKAAKMLAKSKTPKERCVVLTITPLPKR